MMDRWEGVSRKAAWAAFPHEPGVSCWHLIWAWETALSAFLLGILPGRLSLALRNQLEFSPFETS